MSIPYTNQEKTPIVNIINIDSEISLVLFDFQTLNAWGKNAIVVQKAAKKPKYSFIIIKSIQQIFNYENIMIRYINIS